MPGRNGARIRFAGSDGFAEARHNSRVPCQEQLTRFAGAEAPLQPHNAGSWKVAAMEAQQLADELCPRCPLFTPCADGAAAERYTGIAAGAVYRKGHRLDPGHIRRGA